MSYFFKSRIPQCHFFLKVVCTINARTWSAYTWIAVSHWLQSPKEVECNKLSPLHDGWHSLILHVWMDEPSRFCNTKNKKILNWITCVKRDQQPGNPRPPQEVVPFTIDTESGLTTTRSGVGMLRPLHFHHRGLPNTCMRSLFHKTNNNMVSFTSNFGLSKGVCRQPHFRKFTAKLIALPCCRIKLLLGELALHTLSGSCITYVNLKFNWFFFNFI